MGNASAKRGAAWLFIFGEFRFHRFGPAPQHRLQGVLERAFVKFGLALPDVEHEAQHGKIAAFDFQAPVEQPAAGPFFKHVLNAQAHLRGQHVAGHPYECEQVPGQRRLDQCEARTRAIDKAHHRGGNPLHIVQGEADHQIMRQSGQRMDQRLAGMAALVKLKAVANDVEPFAQDRHAARRRSEGGAGPHARMSRQCDQFSVLAVRDDEQIERHPPVDAADKIRLHDQGLARMRRIVEPIKGAVPRTIRHQVCGARAANTERVALRAVAPSNDMPKLGQHAAVQPLQQGAPFLVVEVFGIAFHPVAQFGPIGHGGANVFHRLDHRRLDRPALPRFDAFGLDVDHRFVIGLALLAFRNRDERAVFQSFDRNDGVDQPINRNALRGNRRSDRIDQERHVIVDDGQPRHAPFFADGFDCDCRFSERPIMPRLQHEACRLIQPVARKRRIGRQQRILHPLCQRIDQFFGEGGLFGFGGGFGGHQSLSHLGAR